MQEKLSMITVIARTAISVRAEQKQENNRPTANAIAITPLLTDFLRIKPTDLFRTYSNIIIRKKQKTVHYFLFVSQKLIFFNSLYNTQ